MLFIQQHFFLRVAYERAVEVKDVDNITKDLIIFSYLIFQVLLRVHSANIAIVGHSMSEALASAEIRAAI